MGGGGGTEPMTWGPKQKMYNEVKLNQVYNEKQNV
jgi:hypothetical protein